MKLEDKFFTAFFYPFLIAIFLSALIITLFISLFTNNNFDKITSQYILDLENKYSKRNINTVNVLVTSSLLKIQSSLNEQILFYQKTANKILNSTQPYELNNNNLICALDIDEDFCENNLEETATLAVWLLDSDTNEENLDLDDSKNDVKLQLIAYTNIIENIAASFEATKPNALSYYFYFVKTELYISYPLLTDCEDEFALEMTDYSYESALCVNDEGEFFDIYKIKCEAFFLNIQKSKTSIYDNNYLSNQNRTIFITNFYNEADDNSTREYTMCIEFDDPITKEKGYLCTDVSNSDMVLTLENLNSNLLGYFFISNVGFNNVFYFPQGTISPRTSTEDIFGWDLKYSLEEKAYFYNTIRKIFSSNYIDNFGLTRYDEVFVNGKNTSEQYFYIGGKRYRYSIYPIILENLNLKNEHIFSIIYIYDEDLFFDEFGNYTSSIAIKIILELLLIIIFGSGLIYIIYLTFNTLSKYIVIPIKNVNYMLKGINIGGENRLEYLNFLKKKQDENLEKLEKMYIYESKKNKNDSSEIVEETESNSENYNENDNLNIINKENNKDSNNKHISPYEDYNKVFEEESNYIEKELNFYDFDELLLQYRPLEIEHLVESLIDLKGALILTSSDQEVEQIINYSYSEDIFRNFKNKEGAIICQSNIGNLQSQLLKFDKAIYHLALSLQDNKLKKFLNRNLNDEYDESDFLLNKILNSFNKGKKKEKNNILSEKQKNNSKDNFSQKIIGILINTRYCRLIHVYYMFFKNLQKLKKSNSIDVINGQFMNTFFHSINYYHKILIQYIYLSYVKNDLVKIGESILDYLEFLIKFKFKTSSDNKYFLKINYKDRPKFRAKQEFKKSIFNKIINWFNLFDDYISYVKDYSSLDDSKSLVDDYSKSLNSENTEFNLESQSTLMFRVNIQKSEFLKGKFCLCCKNYNDALFYFIRASKKRSIGIDGLIKKRSLKHIFKLLKKMKKKYDIFRLKNLYVEKEMKEFKKDKNRNINNYINKRSNNKIKITNRSEKNKYINGVTFGEEIEIIKEDIFDDINGCNAKQEKDIIILIDFNNYNKIEDNLHSFKIDSFLEQAKIILSNYLSTNDRLCVFVYEHYYQIICPLLQVNKIDINNFSKDLLYYKNISFNKNHESEEYDINLNDFNLGENNNISEHSKDDSFDLSEKEELIYNKISGFVNAINYINNYSKMKEEVKNEKYIITFTDILNIEIKEEGQAEKIEKILEKVKGDIGSIILLVGKNKKINLRKGRNSVINNDKKFEEIILNKYEEKSEVIYFENMKKIKTILSNNIVIKDEIIYPNEIYK